MARPLIAGLAPDIVLAPDYVLRVTALDPITGATVSGVIISDVAIQVDTEEPADDSPVQLAPPIASFGSA